MSHVNRGVLERLRALDLNLMQRFAGRDHNRAVRLLSRQRRHGPVASSGLSNYESDSYQVCLGGLEVKYSSGSTVTVTAGAVLVPNTAQVTETRPGTFSPAPVEPDDDGGIIAELAVDTTAVPSVPIPGALASAEWWIVTGTVALVTVESDSNRKVFNETTGVFDATTVAKIARWTFVPKVVRGAPGADINTVYTSLSAAEAKAMVGWIRVPAGATDLSASHFFDVRSLPDEDPGPNMCGGHGQIGYTSGGSTVPTPNVAPSTTSGIFRGHFWARHNGELLRASLGLRLSAKLIKEPGATWDTGAAPATPAVAWLYLAKVLGRVPRLIAQGATPAGNVPAAADVYTFIDGALVLSDVAPKISVPTTAGNPLAGGRFDLRPSAALALPTFQVAGVYHDYAGVSTTDAICLGPVVYNGYDLTDDCPLVAGPGTVSTEGWIEWPMGNDGGGTYTHQYTAFFSAQSATLAEPTTTLATLTGSMTVKSISGNPIPFTGLRLMTYLGILTGTFTGRVDEILPSTGKFLTTSKTGPFEFVPVADLELSPRSPANSTSYLIPHTVGATFDVAAIYCLAVRWPFNEPLAT